MPSPSPTEPPQPTPSWTATTTPPTTAPATSTTPSATATPASANHIAAATPYTVPAATVHQWLAARSGPPNKTVFLTYDDGPSRTMTPPLLDTLAQAGVHATFFMVGYRMEQNPALVQRAFAEGHAICLHSYSHDYKYLYPGRVGNAERIAADYDQALAVGRRILGPGYVSPGFRYPGGHMSWTGLEAADAALAARGVSWIDWNCMTGDAEKHPTKTGDQGVDMVVATLAASKNSQAAVVLSHDGGNAQVTLQSLPRLARFFHDSGFGFGIIG